MPPNRKEVDPKWAASMNEITDLAHRIFSALVKRQDPVAAPDCFLAWVTGLRQAPEPPEADWDELTRNAVNGARVAGLSWREIAVITERDESAADRAERRQAWRNQRFETHHLGE